jgi:FkbM family methyltransferase
MDSWTRRDEFPEPNASGGASHLAVPCEVVKGDFRFLCYDVPAFEDAYSEVFEEEVYRFAATTDRPYIIDAGANLGLATCYFEKLYPLATVLAFEPDPTLGGLYRKNIRLNRLRGVTLRQAALAAQAGTATSYGDVDAATPHALGNSLREEWGMQRADSAHITVPTERFRPTWIETSTY